MKKLLSLAVASVLASGMVAAHAATLNTTTASGGGDGILANFSGIDWNANGAAWVQGFGLTSANNAGDTDSFTLTYQGFAASIGTTTATPNLYVASPGPAIGTYELTMFSNISETATCLTAGCTAISIATTGGTWDIYFDITPDANQSAGTGFRTDGGSVSILSGTWTGGNSLFSAALATGGGQLIGSVLSTNNAYVNPNLVGTTLQASLQFPGQSAPTYTRPAAFDGVATGVDSFTGANQHFVLQADTSQNFSVPEPGTVALVGLGLVGLGVAGRRRRG